MFVEKKIAEGFSLVKHTYGLATSTANLFNTPSNNQQKCYKPHQQKRFSHCIDIPKVAKNHTSIWMFEIV